MSEYLPYDEIKFDKNFTLEDILNTLDVSDISYFIEVDLKYPDYIRKIQKIFHLLLKIKKVILIILVIIRKRLNLLLRLK